jgi:hypothetical protein
MEAVAIFTNDENELKRILEFTSNNNIKSVVLTEEEKKSLAGMLLANLSSKNPKAYATMEEIISVVEEVRSEKYNDQKSNNS